MEVGLVDWCVIGIFEGFVLDGGLNLCLFDGLREIIRVGDVDLVR